MREWKQPDYLCTTSTTYGKLPSSLFTLDGLQRLIIDGVTDLEFEDFSVRFLLRCMPFHLADLISCRRCPLIGLWGYASSTSAKSN